MAPVLLDIELHYFILKLTASLLLVTFTSHVNALVES
jgi:hypothetical protein